MKGDVKKIFGEKDKRRGWVERCMEGMGERRKKGMEVKEGMERNEGMGVRRKRKASHDTARTRCLYPVRRLKQDLVKPHLSLNAGEGRERGNGEREEWVVGREEWVVDREEWVVGGEG
ncbi:hypothetical protein Pmani_035777 [Petrolisthes manimaculis]|uniref:Uncharacterized protein n=1 Tax=Petrolisthes manimaculis TaxID=1843537 RepID=A0AAE1NM92_9EUCA|nr:hypothetical protein Pmani_035777 [Petrolisthes manimaculis]